MGSASSSRRDGSGSGGTNSATRQGHGYRSATPTAATATTGLPPYVRMLGLDVHRRFAEVAVHDGGSNAPIGRVELQNFAVFAELLGPGDHEQGLSMRRRGLEPPPRSLD